MSVRAGVIGAAMCVLAAFIVASTTHAAEKSTPAQPPATQSPAAKKSSPAAPVKLVDINSASKKDLKTLSGIGDAEADRIIAGRPYNSKADLATRDVIPTGVYVAIKNSIIAKQPATPAAKK